jgi:hypothetical protein
VSFRPKKRRPVLWAAVWWLVVGAGRGADSLSLGPLYEHIPLTLSAGERIEVAGPFWSVEKRPEETAFTLAPLFSWRIKPEVDACSLDILYPLATYDRSGKEYRAQFLQWLSWSGGPQPDDQETKRFTLFPLYFQSRSANPEHNYTALFPFYGKLRNRLFRDEIKFTLFPLYVQTRKRDVVTDNYLAPFFHLRRGDGLSGWQFWPLAGHEHKEVTSSTNAFGDVLTVAGHRKFFALWPLCFHNDLGLGATNPVTQRVWLPFYSAHRSPARDSTTYLFPFGLTLTEDRERQYSEVGAPWPFIVFARGEGKTASRVWPLFGQARNRYLQSDFYLWPLYKHSRAQAAPLDRERTRILLFLYSDLVERNSQTGKALERTDFWPLFTARRDPEGNQRLQLLALLEPLLPASPSIERNWSPLWALWRSEKNARTGAASQSLLWNVYRLDKTPQSKKCSLLFGLIQYQSDSTGGRWRLFYVPVGGGRITGRSAVPDGERQVAVNAPAARAKASGNRAVKTNQRR